jgi:hypothetical protein
MESSWESTGLEEVIRHIAPSVDVDCRVVVFEVSLRSFVCLVLQVVMKESMR